MLSLIVSSASYNAALRSTAPVVQRAAAPTMKKSEALPFMEEPAHLAGMVGNVGFDPLSLSTPQNIKWMREAELKHGRMCQLAWAGWVAVDLGIKFPGEKYAALTSWTAHDATASYELFMALLFVGTFETIGFSQIYGMTEGSDRAPGDFGLTCLLLKGNEVQYKGGARARPRRHARLQRRGDAGCDERRVRRRLADLPYFQVADENEN